MNNNYYGQNFNNQQSYYEAHFAAYENKRKKMRKIRQDINRISWVATSFFVASVVATVLYTIAFVAGGFSFDFLGGEAVNTLGLPPEFFQVFSALTTCIAVGLPYFIYMKARKLSFSDCIDANKTGFKKATLYTVLGFGLALSVNIPISYISQIFRDAGLSPDRTEMFTGDNLATNILTFIATAIFPAIFEEFAFRGVAYSALKKYGKGFALVVSSLLFGLVHIELTSMLFATVVGAIMCFIYIKTENIWVPVAVHLLNNGFAVMQTIFYDGSDKMYLLFDILFYGIILIGIVSAIIIVLMAKKSKMANPNIETPKLVSEYTSGEKLGAMFSNPGFIAFLLVALTFTYTTLVGIQL